MRKKTMFLGMLSAGLIMGHKTKGIFEGGVESDVMV